MTTRNLEARLSAQLVERHAEMVGIQQRLRECHADMESMARECRAVVPGHGWRRLESFASRLASYRDGLARDLERFEALLKDVEGFVAGREPGEPTVLEHPGLHVMPMQPPWVPDPGDFE